MVVGLAVSMFGGSPKLVDHFCVSVFDRNMASVALNTFLHLI